MNIEYEATFPNINKKKIRKKLRQLKAKLIKPEFLQKRVVFNLPKKQKIKGAWLRVRDEGDKITISLKIVDGSKIENQKEICIEVDDFERAIVLLSAIGCQKKAYQETKREIWKLSNVEISIDQWPFLEPLVEIEGKSEKQVKSVCKKLGLDYSKALFCAVGTIYHLRYGISEYIINNKTPRIVFGDKNPFLKRRKFRK